MMLIIQSLIACVLLGVSLCQQELFKNPGMEDPDIEGAYGHAWGYSMERVNESHTGDYAVKLSDRYLKLHAYTCTLCFMFYWAFNK